MMLHQENQTLLTVESSKSTSISVIKFTGIKITSIFLQGFFLQHLHKDVSNIVSLKPSLPVSIQDDIIRHVYKGFSTVVSLLSSLLTSIKSGFLQSSLLASLRNEFLRSSLLVSLWNLFLWCLYGDISTVTSILSKLMIFLQCIHH